MTNRRSNRIVVITGASGGIGRATALAFAGRGDAVVLAARREDALRKTAAECERLGGSAIAVPTDVTDEAAVENMARKAIDAFGRIDVWVNNAAVTAFGTFEDVPSDVFRRVVETNMFGYVYGARAALRRFRDQNHGVLINVSSVVVWVPQPYTSAYVMTKHAIRALSECLRQELYLQGAPGIHVCTVMPPSVDTPIFQQGANYAGRKARAMPPVYKPERVAETIVGLVDRPRPEAAIGAIGQIGRLQRVAIPQQRRERLLARQVDRSHFQKRPERRTDGNLFVPMPEYARTMGGWRNGETDGVSRTALLAAALLLPGIALWAGFRATGARSRRPPMGPTV